MSALWGLTILGLFQSFHYRKTSIIYPSRTKILSQELQKVEVLVNFWDYNRKHQGGNYHRAWRPHQSVFPPPNFWKIKTMTIFLWSFSINFPKFKEYVVKFRDFAPNPFYLLIITLYSTLKLAKLNLN